MTTTTTTYNTEWLDGIAMLNVKHELEKLAHDPALLTKAVLREIANVNAGMGQEIIALEGQHHDE